MKKSILSIITAFTIILGAHSVSQAGGSLSSPKSNSIEFGVYGGIGESFDSDVSINQLGTNLTFSDVEWDGDSFGPAPYWGVRLTYWPSSLPNWGFMIDYTHAKLIAEENSGRAQNGNNIGDTFNRLEFTDGLNLITANVLYKYNKWEQFTPYAGVGVGLSIPHVEVQQNGGPSTFEYQVTGVAAQALAGIKFHIDDNFSVFGEYKLSYADIEADLVNNGSFETDVWTNHFILGLSYSFNGY